MTETQLIEIRQYLLSKKLPIDILIEVNDHFISQITDLQKKENLSFEEAFEKTKLSWDKELKPYWKGEMNLEDTSDFMRNTKKEIDKANLYFAFKWTFLPFFLIILSAYVLRATAFGYFTITLLSGLALFVLLHYFKNYNDFKLAKKYQNYVLTLHQHSVLIFISIIAPFINIFDRLINNPEKYQNVIKFNEAGYSMWSYCIFFISLYFILFGSFLSLIAQKKYLHQIQKVKPFLKYL